MLVAVATGASLMAADAAASRSPFLPPAAAQASTAPTQDTPLELRGVMAVGDSYMFSIYDPTRHSSTWTGLNDTSHEFIVRSYDAERDAVTVDFQGRSLTLALKTAKVASAPVVTPQPTPPQAGAPQPVGGPVVLNPTPADEQRRLEAIAAEVNRRRMIRQQALQASRQAAGRPAPAPNQQQRR